MALETRSPLRWAVGLFALALWCLIFLPRALFVAIGGLAEYAFDWADGLPPSHRGWRWPGGEG